MFTWLRIVIILTFQLLVQYRGAHDSIVHSPSIFNQNIQNSFFLQKVTIYIYMYNYALIANIREKELIKQKRKWRSICTEIENVPVLCLLQNSTNIIICRYVIFAILKTVNRDKISHQLKIAMTQFCYYFWIDNALHLPL